jgi:hypothetical protein
MKNIYYALLLLLCIGCNKVENPREGDIIFHTAHNEQSAFIEYISQSPINHCGIIIERDSSMYVLHVNNTVTLTPLHRFIEHGNGADYTLMRATNKAVKIDYKKYMLAEYDYQMQLDNNRYYSSELVYEIYKNDLGIELCQPRMVKEHDVSEMIYFSNKYYVKPNNPIITTTDLYNSKELKLVQTHEDRLKKIKEAKKQE